MAGRLTQVTVNEQHTAVLLGQGQRQVDRNGGLAFVFQKTCDHQHLAVAHVLLHPATQFADRFRILETGEGVVNQNTGLFPLDHRRNGFVFLLMGKMSQIVAIQLFLRFAAAADGIAHKGENAQSQRGHRGGENPGPLHCGHCTCTVYRTQGNGGILENFHQNAVNNGVSQRLMGIDQCLCRQKGGAGIGRRHGHGQQIGIGNHRCGDGCIQRGYPHMFHHGFAHNGTVHQFCEQRGHIAGGGEIVVYSGGTTTGSHHENGVGFVNRNIGRIFDNIGTNAYHQCSQYNDQPTLQHIPHQNDGIKGQKTGTGGM